MSQMTCQGYVLRTCQSLEKLSEQCFDERLVARRVKAARRRLYTIPRLNNLERCVNSLKHGRILIIGNDST